MPRHVDRDEAIARGFALAGKDVMHSCGFGPYRIAGATLSFFNHTGQGCWFLLAQVLFVDASRMTPPPDAVWSQVRVPGAKYTWVHLDNVLPTAATRAAVLAGPDRSRFPHVCPRCGAPAYIGFASTECSRAGCG